MSLSLARELLPFRPKTYRYVRLETNHKEIRLLRFRKPKTSTIARRFGRRDQSSKVRCDLSLVPLEHAPGYSALSYAWGSSPHDKEIEVDGSILHISGDLLDALLEFQGDDTCVQKFFWIDAVCIVPDLLISPSQADGTDMRQSA
jgi:hypothetical protein